ncbi:hypothetical protein HDU76_003211 [Blyttiomyces sp. JEL0837]|nr:hypothetical protein HDU76_003211 [Blyttiomyces sp. JEL0837]
MLIIESGDESDDEEDDTSSASASAEVTVITGVDECGLGLLLRLFDGGVLGFGSGDSEVSSLFVGMDFRRNFWNQVDGFVKNVDVDVDVEEEVVDGNVFSIYLMKMMVVVEIVEVAVVVLTSSEDSAVVPTVDYGKVENRG